jgi:hypothetical protein
MRGAGTTARQQTQMMLVGAAGVDLSLAGRGADATVSHMGGLIRLAF